MGKLRTTIAKFKNCELIQENSANGLYYVVLCGAGSLFSSSSIVKAYQYAEWFQTKAA